MTQSSLQVFLDLCADLSACVTGSDDKRRRRKSGSHFSEARKRGRTMLYQLTSQFSRGGKGEVNLGGVSAFAALKNSSPFYLYAKKMNRQSYSDMQRPSS